jgi:hypothetical protein
LVEALGLGTSATHFRYFRGRLLKHHEGRQIIAAYTARAVWRTPVVAAFLSSFCMGSSEELGSPPMGSSGIIGSLLIVLGVILGVIGLINECINGRLEKVPKVLGKHSARSYRGGRIVGLLP